MALVAFFLGVVGVLLLQKHLDDDSILEKIVGMIMLIAGFVLAAWVTTGG